MAAVKYISADLGATSGRVISGEFDGSKISLKEEHRFVNEPVGIHKTVYWDILYIFNNIIRGINKAGETGEARSIGIDSWGNDFALFDSAGRMLENPVHYRDEMTKGIPERLYSVVPAAELYNTTGIQLLRLNGLYRLYAMRLGNFSAYESAERFLMIPDVITYFLTGEMLCERTNASTTQMLSAGTKDWAYGMLEKLDINTEMLSTPIEAKKTRLKLLDGICGVNAKLSVIGTHDTACAVAAVPSREDDFIYISSGTWSLVGTETEQPIINEISFRYNFTNECGVFGRNRLLKNVMGMWILEELKREWEANGSVLSYSDIVEQARSAAQFMRLIDPDDAEFLDMGGMSEKINRRLKSAGQAPAQSPGEFARCLFDSLALDYKSVIERISALTGKRYHTIHVVGGGSKNELLDQIIADVCGMRVVAGPVEATAAGNILTQAYVCGEISALSELRAVSANSFDTQVYEPNSNPQAQQAYAMFSEIISK